MLSKSDVDDEVKLLKRLFRVVSVESIISKLAFNLSPQFLPPTTPVEGLISPREPEVIESAQAKEGMQRMAKRNFFTLL